MKVQGVACASFALVLCACSGGGSSPSEESNQFCHTITHHSISCTACNGNSDNDRAFDGHLATFGTLNIGGQVSFQAKTSRQPGGSIAGVFFIPPNVEGTSIQITTFLGGTQQETMAPATRSGGSDACVSPQVCHFDDAGPSFVGLETTLDYDEIDATIGNNGGGAMEIHEICVR